MSWTPAPTAVAPTVSSVTFAHSYNAVNQRTGQTVTDSGANVWIDYPSGPTATTAYTANALNQYTAVAAVAPTYDGNGNLRDDGTHRYGYDPENRLVSLSPSGSGTACVTACYAFDGRGRRKTKTVGSTTTVSITDADNREVLEYDGSTGAILRWYAYGLGPNALLNQMDVAGGTRTTLLPDQLGSIIGKMDSGSGTVGSFAYRSYGKSSSPPAQFGFTGQKLDAESGNYYYRARHYSPGWGRFLQADPIGHAGGVHFYAYTDNDPLNQIDPSGLDALVIVGRQRADSSNIFGHVSIAITGGGVYSFGTQTALGSAVSNFVNSQSAVRSQTLYTIRTTPEQNAQMMLFLQSQSDNIGLWDNCAARTCGALNAGGVLNSLLTARTPEAVEAQLMIMGVDYSALTFKPNASIPESVTKQFEPLSAVLQKQSFNSGSDTQDSSGTQTFGSTQPELFGLGSQNSPDQQLSPK